MAEHYLRVEIEDSEVENIFQRLEKAQREIYMCYNDLQNLGILKIRKKKEGGESTPPNEY